MRVTNIDTEKYIHITETIIITLFTTANISFEMNYKSQLLILIILQKEQILFPNFDQDTESAIYMNCQSK